MIFRVGNVRYRIDFSYGVPKSNAARWDWENHPKFILGKQALNSIGDRAIHTFVHIKMSEDVADNPKGTPWVVIARGYSRRNRRDRFYKNVGRIVALNHALRELPQNMKGLRSEIWEQYAQNRSPDIKKGLQQLLGLKF